ncbi:MAG: hypothetical protein MJ208_01560 [Bacilli bacterium]|nr:hypothetical protein [Bacilli bacterium]
MFKQQEPKDKNAGFVDEKGKALTNEPAPSKDPINPDDVNLKAEFKYEDKSLEDIENGRIAFYKTIRKENIVKWIVAFVAIAILIVSFVYLIQQKDNQPLMITGYCMLGVSILLIVAYYIIAKKYNDKKMKVYLKRYYGDMNAYVFAQERFKDVNGDITGKIENADFNNSLLYKNVSTVGSRNIVKFKVDGKYECTLCDCAAQMTTIKKLEPLFIGKYLIAPNTYQGDQQIVIYLTGNSRALPPNNVDHLTKVVNTKRMIIYSENKKYESIVNAKVRKAVADLITNNVLVDVSISITKGKTYFGLGYDDCLMVLPLQEKFNPLPVYKYKKDMAIIADIIANLNK